jgi:hypothetical protein
MKLNKISFFLGLITILTSVSWISSCTHDAKINDIPPVCFEGDVLPIFLNTCAISGCHDRSGEAMALSSFADISRGVVPGNSNASQIYQAIIATWGEGKMPPDQPLSLENRTIIRIWIEQGAKDTKCILPATNRRKDDFININN